MGSFTRNVVVQMIDIAMFNLFLDEKEVKKNLGTQGERAMKAVLQISQGVKNTYGERLSVLSDLDWLLRFKGNLPFEEKDITICNLPQTNLSEKVVNGIQLTNQEKKQRKQESTNDIFCFAGFVEPGKHQIIIKDQLTGNYFVREIVVDVRKRDIIDCSKQIQVDAADLTFDFVFTRPIRNRED